jgi:hypothetical protein
MKRTEWAGYSGESGATSRGLAGQVNTKASVLTLWVLRQNTRNSTASFIYSIDNAFPDQSRLAASHHQVQHL